MEYKKSNVFTEKGNSAFIDEDSIAVYDLFRKVKEVVEEVNIFKHVNFFHRNSYGYDGMKRVKYILLAFALNGYASVRELCKYDTRFQFITERQTPSHNVFS